jgi:hypothetical protein
VLSEVGDGDAVPRQARPPTPPTWRAKRSPAMFLDLLAEGGSGYQFFGRSAQKLILARRPAESAAKVA